MAAAFHVGRAMSDSAEAPAPGQRTRGGAQPPVLVINPNTNPAVTGLVRRAAAGIAAPGVVTVVNPAEGPFSIETDEDRDRAEAELLALIGREASAGYGAMALACFDDIGLASAQRLAGVPVISACAAGIGAARAIGRFTTVTTFESAVPTIRELLARYGAVGMPVRAAGIGVAAAAAGERWANARLEAAVRAAIQLDRAEAILLASGGLTGRTEALSKMFDVPVIDAVVAGIEQALAATSGAAGT